MGFIKFYKKTSALILALMLILLLFIWQCPLYVLATEIGDETEVGAEDEVEEILPNYCGNFATWELENNVLTISGKGAISNYSAVNPAPWNDRRNEIKTIVIRNGITSIGNYAFEGTKKLYQVIFANSVEHIGIGAFSGSGVFYLNIPNSVKTISKNAFAKSNLIDIKLSNQLEFIAERTFFSCQLLKSIVIPQNVKKIDSAAFSGCSRLCEVSFPDSLTDIAIDAFNTCIDLYKINIVSNDPYKLLINNRFIHSTLTEINVPKGSYEHFKNSPLWANYKDIIFEGDFEADAKALENLTLKYQSQSKPQKTKVDPFAIAFIAVIIGAFFLATCYYFISTIVKSKKGKK